MTHPDTADTAGGFLLQALTKAGITAHPDGDGATHYIEVPYSTNGLIRVTGVSGRARENETDYPPAEHRGWGAIVYPDHVDGDCESTVFYESANRDLTDDTTHLINAIQAVISQHPR
ncbi:hypothetical protein ABZ864_47650 [Streptomyces sp. NPDC047082]|uniref:hypothetical protein n=1 Tax=Streptomyces sp. NPDC047082 TaxID=3155259 RepID=UPI0033C663B5